MWNQRCPRVTIRVGGKRAGEVKRERGGEGRGVDSRGGNRKTANIPRTAHNGPIISLPFAVPSFRHLVFCPSFVIDVALCCYAAFDHILKKRAPKARATLNRGPQRARWFSWPRTKLHRWYSISLARSEKTLKEIERDRDFSECFARENRASYAGVSLHYQRRSPCAA